MITSNAPGQIAKRIQLQLELKKKSDIERDKDQIQNMAMNGKKSAKGVISIANTSQLLAHENKQKKFAAYSDVEQA